MKKVFLLSFIFLFFSEYSQIPNLHWAKEMGGSGTEVGRSITVDPSGNVYTTGSFIGTVDFDPGIGVYNLSSGTVQAAFISKLDAAGNFIWAKNIVGTANVDARSITLDISDNIYTTGTFSGDADFDPGTAIYNITSVGSYNTYISKFDASGNFIWAKNFNTPGNYNMANSITTDNKKNVFTTGYFYNGTDFDPGPTSYTLATKAGDRDIYVSKLDSSGNFIWVKGLGGKAGAEGYSIAVDTSGYVYTTGYFKDTTDFDPGPAIYNLPGPNFFDVFISKLDQFGNFVWAKSLSALSAGGGSWGQSLTVDKIGNVYTTGFFAGVIDFDPGPITSTLSSSSGTQDIFILKLNSLGNLVWFKQIGAIGDERSSSIVLDAYNNLYSTGYFRYTVDFDPGPAVTNLTSAGNDDVYINKLDSSGNFIWAKSVGGTLGDYGLSIFVDGYKNVHVTGHFSGTCDFDPDANMFNLMSSGNQDVFILKLGSTVGITEYEENNNILIYPNPTSTNLNIFSEQSIFDDSEIEIINQLGQVICKKTFSNSINVTEISAGFYSLKITSTDKQVFVFKFIKE